MTPPPIDMQRAVVRKRAAARGVPLVTPDSVAPLREATAATVALVTHRTYAEVRAGVSFYVPRLVGDALGLLPSSVRDVLSVAGISVSDHGLTLLCDAAWERTPCATWAHECGHHQQDDAVRASGVIGSALWGVGYLTHPSIRGWDEGRCRVSDFVGLVVLNGWSIDDALKAAADGAALYDLNDPARDVYIASLQSAADSLRAGVMPGEGTEIHETLRELVREGWDAGEWAKAIGVPA